ncbi:MAG: hypothetical protein A2287_07565 [Candidatus Melainabacteria bacterium RIFOXYA12_FULL_32_12]|nr:MAG: hypothetical protein A2287_07565 [Candidatus Melainabacteria bacterium RIFOXYA12_FULL_32_12]
MKQNSSFFLNGVIDFFKSKILRFTSLDSEKTSMHKFSKKKSRTFLTANETLQLNTQSKSTAKEINIEAKSLFKELINKPEELFKYIESHKTLVIRAPHVEKILILIGESEGFILPLSGFRAFFLTIILSLLAPNKLKVGFNTPAMFVMRNKPANVYYLAHQFHHWLSYINELPGYDEETSINFKYILSSDYNSNNIDMMSIDDILSLKDAIARDLEAIQFVKDISRELIGQKISSNRLKNGESLNI